MPWANCFPSISGELSIEVLHGLKINAVIQDQSEDKLQNIQILQQAWLLVGSSLFVFLIVLFLTIFL